MPSIATLKLIGYGVGALAIIALLTLVNGWRVERDHLRQWQTEVLVATRTASANPKLDKSAVAQQIKELGTALADTTSALTRQNAAVKALTDQQAAEQRASAVAQKAAQGRAEDAEAVAQRLRAQTRPAGSTAGCEPSKQLQEQWQ